MPTKRTLDDTVTDPDTEAVGLLWNDSTNPETGQELSLAEEEKKLAKLEEELAVLQREHAAEVKENAEATKQLQKILDLGYTLVDKDGKKLDRIDDIDADTKMIPTRQGSSLVHGMWTVIEEKKEAARKEANEKGERFVESEDVHRELNLLLAQTHIGSIMHTGSSAVWREARARMENYKGSEFYAFKEVKGVDGDEMDVEGN